MTIEENTHKHNGKKMTIEEDTHKHNGKNDNRGRHKQNENII
jgi:hypothetical protein